MWTYWLVRTGAHQESSMAFCGEFQKNSKKCRVAVEFTDRKYDCVYYMIVMTLIGSQFVLPNGRLNSFRM